MSIFLYDEALTTKFKSWFSSNQNIEVLSPDSTNELVMKRLDESNDKPLKLPIISLTRFDDFDIGNVSKRSLTYDGMMLDATKEKSLQLDAIPITLTYTLDIWARERKDADELLRDTLFNLINHPICSIIFKYNGREYKHIFNLTLIPNVKDTSNVPTRLTKEQFVRYSIQFEVDDAYIFSIPIKDNIHIESVETVVIDS